jgi:hypothetical protein
VARELLNPIAEIEEPEVPDADVTAARTGEQLPASLQHADAHVVDERTGDRLRAPHADVVTGVAAGAARAVCHEQVVPPVVNDHDGRFRVDRDVERFRLRMQSLAGLRIEFDESDVAEIGPVGEPQPAADRIAQYTGIDRIAVLDAIRPDDRSAVFPLVVRRRGIERPTDQQADGGLRLRAGRGV